MDSRVCYQQVHRSTFLEVDPSDPGNPSDAYNTGQHFATSSGTLTQNLHSKLLPNI